MTTTPTTSTPSTAATAPPDPRAAAYWAALDDNDPIALEQAARDLRAAHGPQAAQQIIDTALDEWHHERTIAYGRADLADALTALRTAVATARDSHTRLVNAYDTEVAEGRAARTIPATLDQIDMLADALAHHLPAPRLLPHEHAARAAGATR